MSSENDKNLLSFNKKVSDLKKKIQLSEGQKKAYVEEWEEQKKEYTNKIKEMKSEIKEIRAKLTLVQNPNSKKDQKIVQDWTPKVQLPPGAKNAQEAVDIIDLQMIDYQKKIDLLNVKYNQRQEYFNRIVEEYHMLLNCKNGKTMGNTDPPETFEEDSNRKLITFLENEIHQKSISWMEGEHIRKKYRGIKLSMMKDSEKFESSLLELEKAIIDQEAEIVRLEKIHKEAIYMRDNTKFILQRQEQTTNTTNRAREKQAGEFKRQVEERKSELEKIERKFFSAGKMVHQDSVSSEDHPLESENIDDLDPKSQALKRKNALEATFRKLMQATGASTAQEVVEKFLTQREASSRLTYLRNASEAEKKELEEKRSTMSKHLEELLSAGVAETDVNIEELEKLKGTIEKYKDEILTANLASERTRVVVQSIRESLIEMLLKLQEIDECVEHQTKQKIPQPAIELPDIIDGVISTPDLLELLESKIKFGLLASGQKATDLDSGVEEDDDGTAKFDAVASSSSVIGSEEEEKGKPPIFPAVYANLVTGRATVLTSPGQINQAIVCSEDEGDVPSRSYVKKQAQMIIDAKSRRKGFRAPRKK